MNQYFASLKGGIVGLLNFSGRDSSATFWPYAITVLIAHFISLFAVMLPQIRGSFARMEKFAKEHPDQATITQNGGNYSITIDGYHPELMPDFAALFSSLTVIFISIVIFLAAAVTRRLHDSGLRGYWGLLPIPFFTFTLLKMPSVFQTFSSENDPDMTGFFLIFFSNMAYIASLGLLLFLLVRNTKQD